ncbi:ecdysone 20-monooxygenase-like isoform X2 [Argiope bruennichi]|nr:ecdysone 20-monooxygenase-like isoform X2 [Argiope bruennichi]XP_055943201.1 ecdysone 20-monooxygenase-like isoform X2 [Argiope bruennichi]XP_055943202.1 ecdysone 20-monooxygenase-like isoform X2 [Argiope bruennichi]
MAARKMLENPISKKIGESVLPRPCPVPASSAETVSIPEQKHKNGGPKPAQKILELKDMPGPWPSIPFIGTSWQYFRGARYHNMNMYKCNEDKYRRYGPAVKEEFQWGKPVVQLFDPEDFEKVFCKQSSHPIRQIMEFVVHYRRNHPEKYDSPGLANALNEEWFRLRNIITPVLSKPRAIKFLTSRMDSVADDFSALLRKSRNPDTLVIDNIQDLAYRMALEGVYMMSLDARLGCLDPNLQDNSAASDMILSVKLLFEAFHELFYGLPLWKWYETESYKKLVKAESLMYEATSRQIQEVIEKLRKDPDDDEEGILRTLIKKNELTDQQLIVSVIDLLSGGIFTVANAFSFLVYHIATNPDVQEKLYAELTSVMADSEVTNERLDQLRYLKACVKEAFRLSPTIPCVNRILTQDMVLSGYKVPAGTDVFCNFNVACLQPDAFPEPQRYNPDRWLGDRSERPYSRFALLPFGYGRRVCIGKAFAEMEMHTALAKLVYNFKLEYVGSELKLKAAFINVPASPISVILRDR